MSGEERFLGLSGGVETASGRVILRRGDPLPDDALDGEGDRLRALGVFGELPAPEAVGPVLDEADVLVNSLTEANAEEDGIGLAAYMKTATIDEVMARVERDRDLAPALISAEQEARGDESRSTLVEKLTAIVDGTPAPEAEHPETPAGGPPVPAPGLEPTAPASNEPVDYSEWKAPQLKAALDERGVEYPKGVVANAKLIELLEANPAAPVEPTV